MTIQSRCSRGSRGIIAIDALFSLLPILIMLLIVMDAEAMLVKQSESIGHRQQVFDKLVSVADYTVKIGAVVREGDTRYPNWIDEKIINAGQSPKQYADALRERVGLGSLYVGFIEPSESSDLLPVCIYRIVVVGEEKAIGRLFVCGG